MAAVLFRRERWRFDQVEIKILQRLFVLPDALDGNARRNQHARHVRRQSPVLERYELPALRAENQPALAEQRRGRSEVRRLQRHALAGRFHIRYLALKNFSSLIQYRDARAELLDFI